MKDYNDMAREDLSRKARKERLKTLFTIDTFEPLAPSHPNKQNKNRNPRHSSKSKKHKRRHSSLSNHHRSQLEMASPQKRRDSTPINILRRPSSISHALKQRYKTDTHPEYNQSRQGMKKLLGSLRRGLHLCQTSSIPNRKLYSCQQQDCWQVKSHPKKLLIRITKTAIKKQYQAQILARLELGATLKGKEMKRIARVQGVSREGDQWAVLTQLAYRPRWNDDSFYLFLTELKSQPLKVAQVTKNISQVLVSLTRAGYTFRHLSLESLFFPIQEVKLGGLRKCSKQLSTVILLQMPHKYRTPPEIINFIRFESGQSFNRDHLDWIPGVVEAGWKIDVWSLGILILELLNGGPLADEHRSGQLWQYQCQLLIRYSYLLTSLPQGFKLMLMRMLSIDPSHRPHPLTIVESLRNLQNS